VRGKRERESVIIHRSISIKIKQHEKKYDTLKQVQKYRKREFNMNFITNNVIILPSVCNVRVLSTDPVPTTPVPSSRNLLLN
jgi:hypothetical protein